jgi:predicted AlkP superfamily pyrophosphatase or phosphodiesterase
VTLEAAQALREEFKLGDGEATDVLTISLSATDFIGHRYGTKGPEMCDHLLRLDDRLGAFLDSLDKVKGQVLVVLAADHGGSDFPERLAQQGYDAGRVPPDPVAEGPQRRRPRATALAYDPLVQAGGIESLYVVGADGKAPTPATTPGVTAAALAILAKRPEVFAAYDANALVTAAPPPKGTPPDEISVAERMRRSAYPGRVGDILVAFQPYQTPASPGASYVASHGSPWNYDRRVPILFWWKGGPARERVLPIETVDIAPTIAAVTGVSVPADVDGRCLPLGRGRAASLGLAHPLAGRGLGSGRIPGGSMSRRLIALASALALLTTTAAHAQPTQAQLDRLAATLDVRYQVLDNRPGPAACAPAPAATWPS